MENPRTYTPSSMQVIEVWSVNVTAALHKLYAELYLRDDDPIVVGINVEHHEHGYDNVLVTAFLDDCGIPEPDRRRERVGRVEQPRHLPPGDRQGDPLMCSPRNQLAEAFIRGIEAGAEQPTLAGDGDAMYQAFREWADEEDGE